MVAQDIVDFRVVAPLILGLSKIYQKKYSYLLSESNLTLESLKNPFVDQIDTENRQPLHYNIGNENEAAKNRKKQLN